jgi:hypothetical protein
MCLPRRHEQLALDEDELTAVVVARRRDAARDALGPPAAVVLHLESDHSVYPRRPVREINVEPMGALEARVENDAEGTPLPLGGDVQVNARPSEQAALVDDPYPARVLLGEEDPLGSLDPGHVDRKLKATLVAADDRSSR